MPACVGQRLRLPIAKQPADFVLQPRPVDPARHAQNRAVGGIAAGVKIANLVGRDRPQRRQLALARAAPRIGILPAAKLEHHLLRRLVLDRSQFLQHHGPARFELVGRQMGPAQQVGKNLQCRPQILRQRGPAETGVVDRYRFAPFDAQVLQIGDELAAVAAAGPTQRHFAGKGRQAGPVGLFLHAAGRHQKTEGRRLERRHRLGHQHQTIFVNVGNDRLGHGIHTHGV